MHRRGEKTSERKIQHREKGSETTVYAEQTSAWSIRNPESGRSVSRKLDRWLCISRTVQVCEKKSLRHCYHNKRVIIF